MNIKYFHLCVCIEDHALQAQYSFRAFVVRVLKSMSREHSTGARLTRSEVEARASPVWCAHKDILRLNKYTSCQEKRDRISSYEWGGQPYRPRPCVNGIK